MNIIFLDFDGVLNSARSFAAFGTSQTFDPVAVKLVERACKEADAQIVVSSSWRIGTRLSTLKANMHRAGAEALVEHTLAKTPVTVEDRGHEIERWRAANDVRNYVIVDGTACALPWQPFVQTDPNMGFSLYDFNSVMIILQPGYLPKKYSL